MLNQSPSRQSNSFNSNARVNNQGLGRSSKMNFDDNIEIVKSSGPLGAATKVRNNEVVLSALVDEYSNNLSQKLGISSTPWYRLMQILKIVFLVLTLLWWFLKSDFINLTIWGLMFYCFAFVQSVQGWLFRLIVISLILSFFTDIAWMIFHTSGWWNKAPYDGDVELKLRIFIVVASYFLFLIKKFQFLLYFGEFQ